LRDRGFPRYVKDVVGVTKESGSDWLKTRKDKSLLELQLESYNWFLTQPRPESLELEVWNRATESVRERLAMAKQTGQPFRPRNYSPRRRY
jgi:hypothetical protein